MKTTREFESFFKDHYQRMYYVAVGLLHDDEAAKDVVSSAFEHVLSRFADLAPDRRSSYLYGVVRNKCADHFRRQAFMTTMPSSIWHRPLTARSPTIWNIRSAWPPCIRLSRSCLHATARY